MVMHSKLTRFWLIRHATVAREALAVLYGQRDVPLCAERLILDAGRYAYLGSSLPRGARWLVTPLSRTKRTAEAIMNAGYGVLEPEVEPDLIEQNFGDWEGRPMVELAADSMAHPFWPVAGDTTPPGGESFSQLRRRVGAALDRRAQSHLGGDVVAISHGGAIRAAVAHAIDLTANQALSIAIENLSITMLEYHARGWRIVMLNEHSFT